MEKDNLKQNKVRGPWWKPAVEVLNDVSSWIIVPIVLALFVGKSLDSHYGTKPLIFLSMAALGFFVSTFGIFKVMTRYMKQIKEIEKEEIKNKQQ